MSANLQPAGPPPTTTQSSKPYAPTNASLGGVPTLGLDVPVTAVFLVLFLIGAATHMAIFQANKKKGHKFIMSGMTFGFCMARTVTCVLRIAWATRPTKVPLAIAAMIFVSAGVVLLFIINLIFTQRVLRATHPHFGWHRLLSGGFVVYYVSIVLALIMLIVCTVQSFYTLNANTRRIDRNVQLFGATYFAVCAFLPIPMVVFGLIVPRKTRVEKFGVGRFRSKIAILLFASAVLTLGSAFRAGTNFLTPRPRNGPAWYHSKACFYVFNFTVEIIVVYLYAILRVDMRFWVPNGSKGPGAYSTKTAGGMPRIMTEEEVFDDEPEDTSGPDDKADAEAGRGPSKEKFDDDSTPSPAGREKLDEVEGTHK
ncbi:MAG: hypothetical protein M1832_003601 [Thelocarpon impressellum]|nr:MAG: hypothetical protein M1832_003601 [Thelocarpon impressellum]